VCHENLFCQSHSKFCGIAKFILRVSPTGRRSYEQLAAEVDLLNFLHARHISVPQPVQQKDGTHIQTLSAPEGPRYAAVFTFAPGASPNPMTESHSYRYGQTIAQIHAAADGYPPDCARPHFSLEDMVDEPLARLAPGFADHQDDFDYLSEISTDLKQAAHQLPCTAPEYGMCHGDVNNSNIHLDDRNQLTIIDFDYAGYGWRVLDIATFFGNQVYRLDKTERTRNIRAAFLAGYQSVRRLGQAELDVLPACVMLRQIWLLGIGARNLPDIGLAMFQSWVFGQCMPFIRAWMKEPW
jgi:Ser/Thr protein kinase RdoA (MazF antagonist)